jgi:hypothetical protein
VFSLAALEEDLKKAYRSVTDGKFGDALTRFTAILHTIPLMVVDTRKEVDDVKELLAIAKWAPPSVGSLSDSGSVYFWGAADGPDSALWARHNPPAFSWCFHCRSMSQDAGTRCRELA